MYGGVLQVALTMGLFSVLSVYPHRYFAPATITRWHAKSHLGTLKKGTLGSGLAMLHFYFPLRRDPLT
jgi:hypothetical protein